VAVESEREPATFPSNTISERVPLTYKQQAIPSPYGMPQFEEPSEQRKSFAIEAQSTDHYLPSTSVDFTGCRVSNYMALLEMADEFRPQKHYLSRPTNTEYAFQPPMDPNASNLVVRATLSSNRSREGLYTSANSFQYNTILKWRGERKRAKVLCPPVSPDNETTKKGAGNVTLSMLKLCGILKVDVSSTNISLGDDISNCWLILVGDGLSHLPVANFKDCIEVRTLNRRFGSFAFSPLK
jgi:hypothetical protein